MNIKSISAVLFLIALFLASPARAAISLVTSATGAPTTSAVNTTGTTLIVIAYGYYPGAGAGSVSDNKSNTWTLIKNDSAGNAGTSLYYCHPCTVGSGHTFSSSGGYAGIAVLAFSGTASSPLDQVNGTATALATSVQTGSVTPSQNNELIIAGLGSADNGHGNPGTPSIDSSFSSPVYAPWVSSVNELGGIAYIIQSSAAAVNPTWSISGGQSSLSSSIATFKASAVATPENVLMGVQ